ncbi:hypothetical protein JI87_002180 [Salmonella enterica subsp. enterica]|nr:hypothetical protein [Salmonella enterica subsp. enterica serovar Poona]
MRVDDDDHIDPFYCCRRLHCEYRLKRRTKNAKTFHDKCENFNFRASNETAALTAVFLFIKWDHFGYG